MWVRADLNERLHYSDEHTELPCWILFWKLPEWWSLCFKWAYMYCM